MDATSGRVQLYMELEVRDGPIRGRVLTSVGPDHPFHGWLELAALIDELLKPTGEHASDRTAPGETL